MSPEESFLEVETRPYQSSKPVSLGPKIDYDIIPDDVVENATGYSKPIMERPMFQDSVDPKERVNLLRKILGQEIRVF